MNNGLPEFYEKVKEKYPEIWEKYRDLGAALGEFPGVNPKTQHLVKLAIAVGAGSEGALHSHVRRARDAGVSDDEIRHTALLAITTIGWPRAMAALSWIEDLLNDPKAG
ncbi:MAG: carboxymuconolactone decarboxylase family protein [Thermodesulfobacteriota bacterium]|nr:MAG: carboxymuconolactone decarboxylase family protein [Thermodesulfobacteriota bacterium]